MDPPDEDNSKDYLRTLAEQKLRSFSIGNMGRQRGLSRKEQEEIKQKRDQEEVGKVYEEFVSTFEDGPKNKLNKTWVKAGTFNAGNRKEDTTDKGKLYKPQTKLDILAKDAVKPVDLLAESKRPEKPGKKKLQDKKKSNLEIFKEELKAIQEEREERHRVKGMLRTSFGSGSAQSDPFSRNKEERGQGSTSSALLADASIGDRHRGAGTGAGASADSGSHDSGDPTTTNLYLGNLSPRLTEKELMELFGKFGPLASIKIMWPRTEDEKSRGRNCGFVAYMSRKDGERALKNLLAKEVDGFEMKMGWGKPVPIPLHPIYVPPAMIKLTMPPDASGLPFNCQPTPEMAENLGLRHGPLPRPNLQDPEEEDRYNRLIHKSTVTVMIPVDRTQLCLINRMIEFVIREGPMFEAMIMNREINNRIFRFLFDNQSPEHVYYRWRLFSLLQGDSKEDWRMDEFRMFKGGSLWKPPIKNIFTSGMPDSLIELEENEKDGHYRKRNDEKPIEQLPNTNAKTVRGLSESQRDRFEDMLRTLLPDRNPIAETMVWCMEHAEAGEEIVECVGESLSILQTPLTKKIARLYLISDILHNCSIKGVPNVSYYRKRFQSKLPDMFLDLHACYTNIDSRIRAEAFKQRVMLCFRAWEDWAIYPQEFLIQLQNIFLGLTQTAAEKDSEDESGNGGRNGNEDDIDGKSLSGEEDVDGIPLDGAALLKSANKDQTRLTQQHSDEDSDVDGAPLEPVKPAPGRTGLPAGFVPSKWETVDPEDVQAQAVTSKWDIFDQEEQRKQSLLDNRDDEDTDIDGVPLDDNDDDVQLDIRLSENRRAKLREVEVEVMRFQDALESGKQATKPGWTISEQVEQHRRKLMKQANKELKQVAMRSGGSTSVTQFPTPSGATPSSRSRGPDRSSDEDSARGRSSSNRGRTKKKRRSRSRKRSKSSGSSRSRSRSRDRDRKRSTRRKRRSTSTSSDDQHRSSKRRRSRTPPSTSSRKHKKKRH